MYKSFLLFLLIPGTLFSDTGVEIAKMANRYIGNPYVYGGNSFTKGIDCSAFVKGVVKKNTGINLPRTATNQALKTRRCSNITSFQNIKIGDAVYFKNKQGKIHHVALVTGFDADSLPYITHAKGEKYGVVREKITNNYIKEFYVAKRFTSCNNTNKIYRPLLVKNL